MTTVMGQEEDVWQEMLNFTFIGGKDDSADRP